MVSSNDFKNGMSIKYDGHIYLILEFMHVKPGKGGAFVRTKLRDMRTGAVIDYTFNAAEKVERAIIDKVKMQYIYDSGTALVFMNNETYEQVEVDKSHLEYEMKFIIEGMNVEIVYCEGEILGINLPDKVTLKVTKCDPAVKGDTKTNALKDAIVETGLLVKVPMFVNEGDSIVISTATGKYDSRA